MSVNVVVTIQQVCAAAASGQGLSRLLATTLQRWRLGSALGRRLRCAGAGRKQRGQDYYCDIISLDSFHAHHNLVHLGVQMNLFPSQLSLYTSGPAPLWRWSAVVRWWQQQQQQQQWRGYNSCLLCPHSGRPRPLYCTVPHSTVLYSGYRWWSLLNISSEIRSCHRDHHKSGGWWLDRRQRIYISFIYS